MTEETAEQKAETLARLAAARAAQLALAGAEKAQAIAVARAVKDANIDRDLRDHERHLEQINGSQQMMAASLAAVEKTIGRLAEAFERQAAISEALAKQVAKRAGTSLSRWTLWIGAAVMVATYVTLVVGLVTR